MIHHQWAISNDILSEEETERERARRHTSLLLSLDRYCQAAILRAHASMAVSAEMPKAMITEGRSTFTQDRKAKQAIFRHCDGNGNLMHIIVRMTQVANDSIS